MQVDDETMRQARRVVNVIGNNRSINNNNRAKPGDQQRNIPTRTAPVPGQQNNVPQRPAPVPTPTPTKNPTPLQQRPLPIPEPPKNPAPVPGINQSRNGPRSSVRPPPPPSQPAPPNQPILRPAFNAPQAMAFRLPAVNAGNQLLLSQSYYLFIFLSDAKENQPSNIDLMFFSFF